MTARNVRYFSWTAAILASLVWHAFVWAKFSPSNPPPVTVRHAQQPNLVYISANLAGKTDTDVNALMTPVLFSLPSAQGFSRPLLQYQEDILPGSYTREEEVALLDRPAATHADTYLSWPWHMDGQVARLLDKPTPRQRDTLVRDSTSPLPVATRIVIESDLGDAEFSSMKLGINPEIKGMPRFWRATAHISFDESGVPDRVFLEEPTGHPELNREIIRKLYLWRIKNPSAPVSGRVVLLREE